MELIDEIMMNISEYVTDQMAVSNCLYIVLEGYDIQKKSTDIVKYQGEDNQYLIKKFLVAKKIKGCTDRTLRFYGKEIPKALDKIGKPVIDITADDIRIFLAYRMREVTATTADNELRCLRTFFTWLNAEELVPRNPTVNITAIKRAKQQKEAFTDIEIVQMRNNLKTSRDKCIFEMLISTGCRVSELCQIKNSEIDGDHVVVHGKGNKDRIVYLNAAAQYALHSYQNDRNDVSEWLFPKKKDGLMLNDFHDYKQEELADWWKNAEYIDPDNHISKGTVEQRIRTLGRKLGIKAYPHKFRRTCATNALRAGMPIEMVSKMLGHEQIGTTQIYLDLKEDDLKMMHQKYVR